MSPHTHTHTHHTVHVKAMFAFHSLTVINTIVGYAPWNTTLCAEMMARHTAQSVCSAMTSKTFS